jgi:Ion channel
VTTITTVGYGDISGHTTCEKLFGIVLMIIGASGFSFAAGSLSSLMSNLDASQAQLKERISTLNDIRHDYMIDPELYDELRKAIKYDHSK